jgi:uncharacterized membrane protein HdeD (DUF308 family)
MNIVLPPILFYVLGALFLVFGTLRVVVLGRRRPERELTDDSPERLKVRRRHLLFGVFWILTGVFLIVTTADILRLRH